MNNIKNTCKGIKNLITWKQCALSNNHHLSQDNETVTNPKKIANIFNDYFSTIAKETKPKIRFSNHSMNFSRILTKTVSSVGPDSLPTKILKLLKNDISLQMTNIFNLSFWT